MKLCRKEIVIVVTERTHERKRRISPWRLIRNLNLVLKPTAVSAFLNPRVYLFTRILTYGLKNENYNFA